MKRLRLLISTLVLLGVLGGVPLAIAFEEAPKCNCTYPNSGKFGVKNGDNCDVVDCWIEIE
ncbi:MAG: hypothetical protein AB1631_04985 [Acidobacteriota bacterium]